MRCGVRCGEIGWRSHRIECEIAGPLALNSSIAGLAAKKRCLCLTDGCQEKTHLVPARGVRAVALVLVVVVLGGCWLPWAPMA